MNGKKAKQIRKEVYGNFSQREERKHYFEHGSLMTTGLRRAYQLAKKAAK